MDPRGGAQVPEANIRVSEKRKKTRRYVYEYKSLPRHSKVHVYCYVLIIQGIGK